MSRRSRAREIVIQVLYQSDLNPDQPDEVAHRFVQARLSQNRKLIQFAKSLLEGVRKHRAEIDSLLEEIAKNWSLYRMPVIDRNIMRLGAYEILFTDVPDRVAINEAIELAKRYGSQQSPQFVNGMLDRLMHQRPTHLVKPLTRNLSPRKNK